jgi:ABC-type anion transport system duplicated permease subunit
MAGRCFGLGGLSLVAEILIPAALPSILAGFKIGWAFAWRTLIAAELVFGVAPDRAASAQGLRPTMFDCNSSFSRRALARPSSVEAD